MPSMFLCRSDTPTTSERVEYPTSHWSYLDSRGSDLEPPSDGGMCAYRCKHKAMRDKRAASVSHHKSGRLMSVLSEHKLLHVIGQ